MAFQRVDPRAEAASRGNRGVEGNDYLGVAQELLLARIHAAAMGADHLVVEEAKIGQVLRRQAVAMCLHRRDLAPDLVEMDGDPGAELALQGAEVLEQLGRAHVRRPGRDGDADAAVRLAVPFGEGPLDRRHVLLAHGAVELERCRIADCRAGPVIGAFAEQETQAAAGQCFGVVVDVAGILQHEGDAAAQALERAELRHHPRLVRRRQVLEHAARQGHGEMGMGVGEARHHHAAAPVDPLGRRIALLQLGIRPDRGDPGAVDRDRGAVMHRVLVVAGDDHGIVDDGGHGVPKNCRAATVALY